MERQPQRTFQIVQEKTPTRCEICHQDDQFDPVANLCHRCAPIDVVQLSESLSGSESLIEDAIATTPSLPESLSVRPTTLPDLCQPSLSCKAMMRLYFKALRMVVHNLPVFLGVSLLSGFSALLLFLGLLSLSFAKEVQNSFFFFLFIISVVLSYLVRAVKDSTTAYLAREISSRGSLKVAAALGFIKNRQPLLLAAGMAGDIFSVASFFLILVVSFFLFSKDAFFSTAELVIGSAALVLIQTHFMLVTEAIVFERRWIKPFWQSYWLTTSSSDSLFAMVIMEWFLKAGLFLASVWCNLEYTNSYVLFPVFYVLLKIPFDPIFQSFRTLLYLQLQSQADGHPLQLAD